MANSPDPDVDDDFTQLHNSSNASNAPDKAKTNKRSHASSDEDEEPCDPNATPNDFISREAKLREAISKATERNWKKRKEEELICGESVHFMQGCPSTLVANHKPQDFRERIPARAKHVKAIFTKEVIHKIEKDIGCRIKVEEKCIVISGKDRLILSKGINVVRKVKEEGERKHCDSQMRRSISPEKSCVGPQIGSSDSQNSDPSPMNTSQFPQGRHDKVVEELVREDFREMARASSRAFADDGARGCSSRLKSPAHPRQRGSSYDGHRHWQNEENYKTGERRGSDKQCGSGDFAYCAATPRTLEELELVEKRESVALERIREKQEEEENKKHLEVSRAMRESYIQKLAGLRGTHAKQREEFRLLEVERKKEQQARRGMSTSGGFGQPSSSSSSSSYSEYAEANVPPMGWRDRYPAPVSIGGDSVSWRRRQHHKGDDYGKASDRY